MVKKEIYDAFQQGDPKILIFFHGYTYSAHPLASAAMFAPFRCLFADGLFERAGALSSYWEEGCHSLKGTDHFIDVRNLGLVTGIEMRPKNKKPGPRL
ncbi:MAG: hypothetical protein Ct9H300mP9_0540 [Candidatus Neomarinimicrobiota bacterium]|nr:MAG: hypothetical protein Ct9H300mP9_0540 [Candidatus Neomarinimicrobiota bacterium]